MQVRFHEAMEDLQGVVDSTAGSIGAALCL
jgi:hypothetical protein